MKKLALIILLFFTTSCQTPEQLIREERIQQGMSKNAIWNAMVDVLYADDISMPNCFRAYYPDTKHEILSSSSRKIFYVFGNVTIPASVLDCDDQGNGYLEQIYRTYEESLASISSISESKNIPKDSSIRLCPDVYDENTWTDGCFGKLNNDDVTYEGTFLNGLPHGQGVLTSPDAKISGTFENGSILRGKAEGLDGSFNYDGEFKDNAPHGQGTLVTKNNDKYTGEFKNGDFDGYGKYITNDGEIIEGMWKEDEYIGPYSQPSEPRSVKNNDSQKESQLIEVGSGTGFAITKLGHLVTNHHVIDGCQEIKVRSDGEVLMAKILAFDPINDLAVLRAEFEPKKSLSISKENPRLLEDIYVAGFPFGDNVSTSIKVTKGIVSSLTGLGNNFSNIQIDAALQPGNSGGPIVNENGIVVAVAVAKLDALAVLEKSGALPENTNFGIKSNVLMSFLESNRINPSDQSLSSLSNVDLGELLTDATYFLSCEMTADQIEAMKSKKVLYRKFFQSN